VSRVATLILQKTGTSDVDASCGLIARSGLTIRGKVDGSCATIGLGEHTAQIWCTLSGRASGVQTGNGSENATISRVGGVEADIRSAKVTVVADTKSVIALANRTIGVGSIYGALDSIIAGDRNIIALAICRVTKSRAARKTGTVDW